MYKKIYTTGIIICILLSLSAYVVHASPLDALSSDKERVPVIMYHKVTNNKSLLGKWAITPEEFENDLKYLKEHGYQAITMSDLVAFVHNGERLPSKPIVLTFDDGDFSIYKFVYPLLQKYETKAVVSIIGKITDEYTKEGREDITYPHMTWDQIKEIQSSGLVEIQNHSYNLHGGSKSGSAGAKKRSGESNDAYKARLSADLNLLQKRVEEITGAAPNTFVYPFGAVSSQSDDILRELGFHASLTCFDKVNLITAGDPGCLFHLGRTLRPHGRLSSSFFEKLEVAGK